MISGALLLNPGKTTGWKDVRRYERRMALVLATFGYLYCLLEQYSGTRQLAPPSSESRLSTFCLGRAGHISGISTQ